MASNGRGRLSVDFRSVNSFTRLVALGPITDGERARAFYEGVLGLDFVSDDGFALVMCFGDTPIRLVKVELFTPQPFTVLGWQSPDVHGEVARLAANGVVFERFEGMDQDAAGIWSPPGGGHVAWFKDPDGNLLSVSGHTE